MTTIEVGRARVLASAGARAFRGVWGVTRWWGARWRFSLIAAVAVWGGYMFRVWEVVAVGLVVLAAPALVSVVWQVSRPVSYDRWVAGPSRRRRWRRWARRSWPVLARECGLSVERRAGDESVWVAPKLQSVSVDATSLSLFVRARVGQTLDDLEAATAMLATAADAVASRVIACTPSSVEYRFVMRQTLDAVSVATVPGEVVVDAVRMGRRQDGTDWWMRVRGRHTFVMGVSGSGKGSILWGVAGGLAAGVRADVVRLWGIDLKHGVEVAMGRALFTEVAYDAEAALVVLRRLLVVIKDRGDAMAGLSRLHEPTAGDPLHVLVIDELAALTAYTDTKTRGEANRLLSEILTQGRALGVAVVACVQDPRKETVSMRGLFTQTVALRLASREETRMALGDGTVAKAPAHRIAKNTPGVAWVVDDDGTFDRVRADYWPDDLVRQAATRYPAPVNVAAPVAPVLDLTKNTKNDVKGAA